MPTPTYTPMANITLGSSAASVTFSSISQAYRDLVLVVVATTASSGQAGLIRVNSDSGANYNRVFMLGDGSSAVSNSFTGQSSFMTNFSAGFSSTVPSSVIFNLFDYSATNKHKTALNRNDQAATGVEAQAMRWASTSAVTSLSIQPSSGNFNTGSTFALYGIAA